MSQKGKEERRKKREKEGERKRGERKGKEKKKEEKRESKDSEKLSFRVGTLAQQAQGQEFDTQHQKAGRGVVSFSGTMLI